MEKRKESAPPRRDFPRDRDHDANRRNRHHKDPPNYHEEAYADETVAGGKESQKREALGPPRIRDRKA